MWYPSVPSPRLHLNADSFNRDYPQSAPYEPLLWVQFGGSQGADLRYLTEVRLIQLGDLASIEFHYDQTDRPIETVELGLRDMEPSEDNVLRLPIDGRGGEYIAKVCTSTQRSQYPNAWEVLKREHLYSLTVGTVECPQIIPDSQLYVDHHKPWKVCAVSSTANAGQGFGGVAAFAISSAGDVSSERSRDYSRDHDHRPVCHTGKKQTTVKDDTRTKLTYY